MRPRSARHRFLTRLVASPRTTYAICKVTRRGLIPVGYAPVSPNDEVWIVSESAPPVYAHEIAEQQQT